MADQTSAAAGSPRVYELRFGLTPTEAAGPDTDLAARLLSPPIEPWGDRVWGWTGHPGPGIDPRTWPRSPLSGLPMRHAITLRLPADYQRRGPEFPGVSYFLGEGQFAEAWEPEDDDDPFAADVRASKDHPCLERKEDLIDQQFALVWLTERELAAGPAQPPADSRRDGEHESYDGGDNAWDVEEALPLHWVYLAERLGDPNAGLAPEDGLWAEGDYIQPGDLSKEDKAAAESWTSDHLGGTTYGGGDGLPGELTPYYLELSTPTRDRDYGNAESHLIDLESGAFAIC